MVIRHQNRHPQLFRMRNLIDGCNAVVAGDDRVHLCLRCQLFQIRHRLLAQMEQLLFTIHFIRILSHSNGHGNDGLCAHAHQFLDQPVLYGSKSRKAVKHHYTAL